MVVGVENGAREQRIHRPRPEQQGADVLQLNCPIRHRTWVNSQPAVPDEPDDPLVCHGVDLPVFRG